MPLILDTGPIYSSIDRSDPDHRAVVDLLRSTPRPHVVVQPVLVEVDYWIRKLLDVSALSALVQDLTEGRYELVCPAEVDLARIAELESQYSDSDLGFVDAALVAMSERLDIDTVATFDHRHFGMIQPRNRRHLNLVP